MAAAPEIEAVVVRPATSSDDGARDAFVRGHERGTFFHLRGWSRVVERVYGHRRRDLYAWRADELVGVLPLVECKSLSQRRQLISSPYAVYGGALGIDRPVEHALVEAAKDLARELRVGHVELRCREDPGLDLPGTDLYATFIKPLPEDPGEVLTRMPKKARAEARKARNRHGLELSRGAWYVDDLARLFLENKLALGSPALPAVHFRALLDEFGSDVHVHLVRKRSTPIAAVMSFAFEETLIAYYAGTHRGADRTLSASNYMYMALQEWAVERGFRTFDFCRSRTDSGAFRFKCHQGFEPQALHYRYHLERRRKIPSFTPSNPRTAFLRNTWSRLPIWLARLMSDRLARYIC